MKEKNWYEVKVNGETLAKVKSKGLAYHVKKLFEEVYATQPTYSTGYNGTPKVTVE